MKILFSGEGGQGVQAIAEILAKAAFNEKKIATYIPNFGVEQRGGISLAFVIISQKPIYYPKFETADFLAVLSDRAWERVESYVGPETQIVFGPAVKSFKAKGVKLDRQTLPAKVWNIIVLGWIVKKSKLVTTESIIKAMEERFARQYQKNPELKSLNLKALQL